MTATFTTIAQVEAAATKELIAYYNAHATKAVTKFADRKTAVKRCVDLMMERGDWNEADVVETSAEVQQEEAADAAEQDAAPVEGDKKFVWPFAAAGEETKESTAAKAALDAEAEAKPVTRKPSSGASNAAGVAASWCDPEVAKARLTRDGVQVTVGDDVQTFKSTRDAFRALRLMDSKHIRFRGILKAAGRATYTEGGKDYEFAII
jgi:hypothetical protein